MDILSEARARTINYDKIKESCYFDVNDNRYTDVSVIIPVFGRTQFNRVTCDYFLKAIQYLKDEKKVSVTIVEHSDTQEHKHLCYSWVNYIWIPRNGQRFNKCLAHNIGALFSNKSDFFLFHDIDTIVPEDFFKKLFVNIKNYDAVQSFTKRRLLYCNEKLTQSIIEDKSNLSHVWDGSPSVKVGASGASGGSMFVSKEIFNRIGGFDDIFFTEYSVEDQFFFDKLTVSGKLGFCDNPPIDLVHLYHLPSFNRTTKVEDFDALSSFNALSPEDKLTYFEIKRSYFKDKLSPKITTDSELPFQIKRSLPIIKKKVRIVDNQFSHAPNSFGCGDLKGITPHNFDWVRCNEPIGDVVVITENSFHQVDSFSEFVILNYIISFHIYLHLVRNW